MNKIRQLLKKLVFKILGKDPEAVVLSVLSGDAPLASAMATEFLGLVPDRQHLTVRLTGQNETPCTQQDSCITIAPGSTWDIYSQLRRELRRLRIGQAAVLFTSDGSFTPLRRAVFLLCPSKILAFNANLERHHLQLQTWISSWLFLRGVPLDRIHLRPWWMWPLKGEPSTAPGTCRVLEGRPLSPARRRVAVLSPYFPYPLSHGGAVRIFNLLREAAGEFDLFLFAFTEDGGEVEAAPVLDFCARVILVPKPRYREPRWSSLLPPEVCEYNSPAMRAAIEKFRREYAIQLTQVEYTQLAAYGGDILVEHDVTWDLYQQVFNQARSRSAKWDLWRWRRFESSAVNRHPRVVAMSEKDVGLLGVPHARVIPNGVDLDRFQPEPEQPVQHLLFIGSFRHFPNIVAYRFFTEQVWPLVRERCPEMTLTVVAGPDPLLYWRACTHTPELPPDDRIRLLGFVRDVRPLYVESTIVIVPTLVSAGTNVKVLEAMAMERAVVSTRSGCAGLGVEHGKTAWIAGSAEDFAKGVEQLARDSTLRRAIARNAREHVEQHFDWRAIGQQQRLLWRELLAAPAVIRHASHDDLPEIARIQAASPEAATWNPESYLDYECFVAVLEGRVAGFLATRTAVPGETEILNIAVAPDARRRGLGQALLFEAFGRHPGEFFLEVRESNRRAQALYGKLGFGQAGIRRSYYDSPREDGIVMRLRSC
ncbi:MAG: ribosomal protein S18-alanine N-acetyltransferase [Bryobacteraceae bacterium]